MAEALSLDDYIAAMLNEAAAKYPEAGFMLIVSDDAKEGEVTTLSNMDADEAAAVLELVQAGYDSGAPQTPIVPHTRH